VKPRLRSVSILAGYPYPNLADPFGNAIEDKYPLTRNTYFAWPSTESFLSSTPPAAAQQIVSNAVKNSVGSGVIASANPWAPKATLAQTIIELLTGYVPSVLKNLRKHLYHLQSLKKTAGSDWLNYQFGWVPLINDIKATTEVLLKLHMLLYDGDTYRRTRGGDLGTWARIDSTSPSPSLGFRSPLDPSTVATPYFSRYWDKVGVPYLSPGPLPVTTKWSRNLSITADFRFSAKYHRGARPNSRELAFIERGTELLGLEITPAVLWEITPWTWLLDWGSNLGSVAANLSQLDWSNVLLDYAYLTFVVKTKGGISAQVPSTNIGGGATLSHTYLAQGFESEEKVREQASPYGFSVSWNGLSPFQLSILAALGMSRGR
jgi:hypothetical protein